LHPQLIRRKLFLTNRLRQMLNWHVGTVSVRRDASRACRDLASPDAGCQGGDHAIGAGQRLTLRVECQPGRPPLARRSPLITTADFGCVLHEADQTVTQKILESIGVTDILSELVRRGVITLN
jgi:hypothetical protein